MKFLNHDEKVLLVILITLTLISVAVSTFISVNQTGTNMKTCCNNKIYVLQTGAEIEKDFREKYEGLQNKIANYDIVAYNPPIKGSNLTPQDWNQIAMDIQRMYASYDAFIILSSHDVVPYTASALSFILENLGKPVIVTDGDFSEALVLGSNTKFSEVMVANKDELLRGCRTAVNSGEEFISPMYPALSPKTALPKPTEPFKPKLIDPKLKIIIVKVYPGMGVNDLIGHVNNKRVDGIILELWGDGDASQSPEFLKAIQALTKKGVVIVAVSQYDEVQKGYEADIRLIEAGVLSGHDMTTPAAFAKLAFLLGNVEEKKLLGQLMDISFRGEMLANNVSQG